MLNKFRKLVYVVGIDPHTVRVMHLVICNSLRSFKLMAGLLCLIKGQLNLAQRHCASMLIFVLATMHFQALTSQSYFFPKTVTFTHPKVISSHTTGKVNITRKYLTCHYYLHLRHVGQRKRNDIISFSVKQRDFSRFT